MKLIPEYCENIIVCVKYRKNFEWYVTDKELWYLDYQKQYEELKRFYTESGRSQKQFEHDMGDFSRFCGRRFGIAVVDRSSCDAFFRKINGFKTDTYELKELYLSADDKSENMPVLLTDFDGKALYNYCPEPIPFHEYVPKGWTGEYRNFYDLLPESLRFWE